MTKEGDFVRWFSELSKADVAVAGGKGASLAEMHNNKFPVPAGFVITTAAYEHFIAENKLGEHIATLLREVDVSDMNALAKTSEKIRAMIEHATVPEKLREALVEAYDVLDVDKQHFGKASEGALDILRTGHEPPFVAVRSSAVAEDSHTASFAGQQESFLNVKGDDMLMKHVKRVFSSLFTPRALAYRAKHELSHENASTAVVVQRMVDAVKSGVMFSKNPVTEDGNIIIESVWGLGEGLVSGKISPDHHVVSPGLDIVSQSVGKKDLAVTRNSSGKTAVVKLSAERSEREVLSGHEIKLLAQFAQRLEDHYQSPQDIEFAINDDGIFIVQSRPITRLGQTPGTEMAGNALLSGKAASGGVATGLTRVVRTVEDAHRVERGSVLVAADFDPAFAVALQQAAAVITDGGGVTSHAVTVAREMGIPVVVGTRKATELLQDGQRVTVDGHTGKVIEGQGVARHVDVASIVPTKTTQVAVVVDTPEHAKRAVQSDSDTAGLVRLESVGATAGKHPYWYITENKLDEYISILSQGLREIVAPFANAWVRVSDFKMNEYQNLEGAPENTERNPLLGDHGIRFSLRNQDFLEAELAAVKDVADAYGEKQLGVLLPHVISVAELVHVKEVFSRIGMPENVILGITVGTPAVVQLINDFCEEGVDFVSIDLDSLTQYTLAVDRDNDSVESLYDVMHQAVLNSLQYVLRRCKRYGVTTSLFNSTEASDELMQFLVEQGIGSVTVAADQARHVSEVIAAFEQSGDGNEKQGNESVDEEKLILQALEDEKQGAVSQQDEYQPGTGKQESDVPVLNEAIPVDSAQFASEKSEADYDLSTNVKNPQVEVIDTRKNATQEEGPPQPFFEHLLDMFFFIEVKKVIAEYEAQQAAATQQAATQQQSQAAGDLAGPESGGENEVLDIF